MHYIRMKVQEKVLKIINDYNIVIRKGVRMKWVM